MSVHALSRRTLSWVAVLMFVFPAALLAQAGTIIGRVTDAATR